MSLNTLRILRLSQSLRTVSQARFMSGGDGQQPSWGSGAGKGGGSGGAVRDAGGAFGKRGAAKEEQYFKELSRSQVEALKHSVAEELEYHKDQMKDHQEAIERHKRKLEELKKITEKKD